MKNIPRFLSDFFFVIRGLWLLLFINILAYFAFGITSQGPDVLLCIVEDFHGSALHSSMTFFALLIGLVFWSVTAEFAARMTIYMSDNSGHQLTDERVEKRKNIQRRIIRTFLMLPSFSISVGFIRALIINWSYIDLATLLVFILMILVFSFLPFALYKCYYGSWGKKLVQKWPAFALDDEMKNWAGKLYGIFNDVILSVRLVNNEKPEKLSREDLKHLTGRDIPEAFGKPLIEPDDVADNVWWFTFKIPLSFYRKLLRQFFILCIISIVLVLAFSFLRGPYYEHIGTAGLLSFAFASWPLLYVFLNFLDKAQPLRVKLPYRFLMLLYIVFCSIANDGHPVRTMGETNPGDRLTIRQHFDKWYQKLEAKYESQQRIDTQYVPVSGDSLYHRVISRQSIPDSIPVIFVAAEGGAFRSGAYAAMMLAELQDSFPQFKDHIYAYSTVSGGTVGANIFQSMGRLNMNKRYDTATYEFFRQDYLSALTGKLVFGELLNCFWPCHENIFDRQVALEEGWEDGWKNAVDESDPGNYLKGSFDQNIHEDGPALFINTMEVPTGLQCVWSNVQVPDFPYSKQRDLLSASRQKLYYTTAIGLSARFPLISPSGKINTTGKPGGNSYVDGGYYENKGQETLLQVLQSLDFSGYKHPPKIYVVQFNFGDDAEKETEPPGLKIAGGLSDIISGIYNTRSGRGDIAQYNLRQYMNKNHIQFVNLSPLLSGQLFPMDWVLSNSAMERMRLACRASARLQKKDSVELKKLKFLYEKK